MDKRSKQVRHLAALRASKKAKQERQTDQDISGEPADDTAPEPDYQLLSENVPEAVRALKECIPPAFLSRINGYSGSNLEGKFLQCGAHSSSTLLEKGFHKVWSWRMGLQKD